VEEGNLISYWSSLRNKRISRRRALAATGGTAAAAALLAACGGGDDGGSSEDAASGLITRPVDTTKEAKRGGVNKWFQANEPAHLDIHTGLAPLNTPNNLTNSLLVNHKAGHLKPAEFTEFVPDLAESWEWSGDRLSLTMKLRQGVKWHNKPPINGRTFDVDDAVFSWERFSRVGQGRTALANSANPNAPVLSLSAVDSRTIVWKFKEPVVYFLTQLTPTQTGNYQMVPKETDTSFDKRKDLIGTGPFVLTEYTPSVRMVFERNPDYWDLKNGPYFD
jgi:peptide/nickel transport system substrate-binding protein